MMAPDNEAITSPVRVIDTRSSISVKPSSRRDLGLHSVLNIALYHLEGLVETAMGAAHGNGDQLHCEIGRSRAPTTQAKSSHRPGSVALLLGRSVVAQPT